MSKKTRIRIENIFNMILIIMFFIASMSLVLGIADAANYVPVCGNETNGTVRCFSNAIANDKGKPFAMSAPSGYGPANFLTAYNLSGKTNRNQIIAIVDAYDNPNIRSDLNTYNSQFNLPSLGNCQVSTGTTTSPCFQKIDQKGGTNYPIYDPGWGLEIALDVEIAHAICKNCNILLVEANTNSYDDIMIAFDKAVSMGANIISNSYGSGEWPEEISLDNHFNLPGKAITFSSGDYGYWPAYPAASPYVTSVGGTTLSNINPRTETVWSGSGSGCSAYESKPSFQKDNGCSKRTIADVSADADPNTGAAIYDSLYGGWFQVGGTSLSSPMIAGVYAQAKGFNGYANSVPYKNYVYGTNINDITNGSNGNCGTYLCNGVSGYDGPTGIGSPIGTGAFEDNKITEDNNITVKSPNGGENWQIGSKQTINWSYAGNVGSNVEIDLLNGSSVKVIATNISLGNNGTGVYNWQIGTDILAGNNYKIKIKTDLGFNDTSDSNFSIINPTNDKPNITVISPNGGENWPARSMQNINWNYTGNAGTTVKIDLMEGSVVKVIAPKVYIGKGGNGSYRWKVLSSNGNDFQIRITSNLGFTDKSDNNFTISSPNTGIKITSPVGGENWPNGSIQTISWSFSGIWSYTGGRVNIELLKGGKKIRTIAAGLPIGKGKYKWNINSIPGSDYQIRVKYKNYYGASNYFTIS